ncbi:unnamed protein product [Closterium sp. Naga37s-1]|nr:unnamed protein product [Closterium sp. Naga37s-1]
MKGPCLLPLIIRLFPLRSPFCFPPLHRNWHQHQQQVKTICYLSPFASPLSSHRTTHTPPQTMSGIDITRSLEDVAGDGNDGESDDHVVRLKFKDDNHTRDWEGGLCQCWFHDTLPLCAITAVLPCITFARIVNRARLGDGVRAGVQFLVLFLLVGFVTFFFQIVGGGWRDAEGKLQISGWALFLQSVAMWGAIIGFSFWLGKWRADVRRRLGIRGSGAEDFCVMFCCTSCSLCQQSRTIDAVMASGLSGSGGGVRGEAIGGGDEEAGAAGEGGGAWEGGLQGNDWGGSWGGHGVWERVRNWCGGNGGWRGAGWGSMGTGSERVGSGAGSSGRGAGEVEMGEGEEEMKTGGLVLFSMPARWQPTTSAWHPTTTDVEI